MMGTEFGRSGAEAPSGHSAEPEPCSTVSAVPVSVPNAAMPDAKLIEYALSFRNGILGSRSSQSMCAAVSWPLAGMLRFDGIDCEAVESDLSEALGLLHANHVWIKLADGRALDPTADQFNRWGYKHPPVYLGPPTELHGNPVTVEGDAVRRLFPASAIEARRAETQGGSVADESAVANGETPTPSSAQPGDA